MKNGPFFFKVWSEGCQHPRGAFFFLKNDPFFLKVWSEGCQHPRGAFFFLKNDPFFLKVWNTLQLARKVRYSTVPEYCGTIGPVRTTMIMYASSGNKYRLHVMHTQTNRGRDQQREREREREMEVDTQNL